MIDSPEPFVDLGTRKMHGEFGLFHFLAGI
jgi:hypothetical protein